MAKITYEDKVAINENAEIPDINKCKASDLNEIKSVVNTNDNNTNQNSNNIGNLNNLNTTSKNNLVNAINEVYQNNIYSTNEQKIGKWIDGKPIYRKVIQTIMPSVTGSWTNLSTLLDVSSMIKLNAVLVGGDGRNISLPYYENTDYYYSLSYQPSANSIQIIGNGDIAFKDKTIIIFVEYTKTTD